MVVAEFCANHCGDKRILQEMVHAAAEAGAQFAKIQTFYAADLTEEWQDSKERVKKAELTWSDHKFFVEQCRKANITPMTSVYSTRYANGISAAGIKHIKIGSAQCTNRRLIDDYVDMNFKVVVSTGGHTLAEVSGGVSPLVYGVLHCVSLYPTKMDELNMSRMRVLKHLYPDNLVGFSDHTKGTGGALAALYRGADIIEKHFTLLPKEDTKDGPVSANYKELKAICAYDRQVVNMDVQREEEIELIKKYKTRWSCPF